MTAVLRRRIQQNQSYGMILVNSYNIGYIPRCVFNRRYRYPAERRRLEREILAHYYELDRLYPWIENSRKVICILVFLISTLLLMTSFSSLYVFLLKLAVWSSIVVLVSSLLLLGLLCRRREVLNGMIRRGGYILTLRPPEFLSHIDRLQRRRLLGR